jgi:hypothetical protein
MDPHPQKRRGPLMWLAGRSRRFWIVIALLPVLYVASFGPACWITSRLRLSGDSINFTVLPTFYHPLLVTMFYDSRISTAVQWYARLGAASDWHWINVGGSDDWFAGRDGWVWVKIPSVNRPAAALGPPS